MIDKELVKKRFLKGFKTYDENALIQKIMAEKLISFLQEEKYDNILEIGSATGLLTKKIKEHIEFKEFSANDIVAESKHYVEKIICLKNFISGDIETIILPETYDLIISNACLQWCNDVKSTILKLYDALNKDGILVLSIFGDENLQEIKQIFKIDNKSYSLEELYKQLGDYNIVFWEEEKIKQYYESFTDILRHLKLTGVNAVKEIKLTKSSLQHYQIAYQKLFSENDKVYLTYNPVYIILKKL